PTIVVGGYIEPVPVFYSRLLALVNMTLQGLDDLQVLDDLGRSRLESMRSIIENLLVLSEKELSKKELSEIDKRFIDSFDESLQSTVAGVDEKSLQTLLVADVHTDTNSQQVLEEAVGYLDLILVVYPDGDTYKIGVGPVFSYYEFKHPMDDRLTDEKWSTLVDHISRPSWSSSFIR
ncbi:MAG TPA: DUF3160 domain-containing protein, partial [Thermoplasmatales archaeon]|nr:DUF3160 domain-containing protein [Thermoplasmatales archaeon]